MVKIRFIILFTLLTTASCKNKSVPSHDLFKLDNVRTIEPDKLIKQKIHQLDIDSLENGFDSIQIRIWFEYSLVKSRNLLILKYEKSKWYGLLYTMTVDWNAFKQTDTILSKSITELTPKSGWTNFTEKLSNLEISSLPDMDDIPELMDSWDDGTSYSFEIAKGSKYRFYCYHVPEKFKSKYWQASKVCQTLALINSEFNLSL